MIDARWTMLPEREQLLIADHDVGLAAERIWFITWEAMKASGGKKTCLRRSRRRQILTNPTNPANANTRISNFSVARVCKAPWGSSAFFRQHSRKLRFVCSPCLFFFGLVGICLHLDLLRHVFLPLEASMAFHETYPSEVVPRHPEIPLIPTR